jgi:hypothetical protein
MLNFLKVLLLMLGAALIIGGSLTGLCGVIVKEGELAMLGFVPAALGLWMFIAISRSFRKKGQQTSIESGEEQPPANPLPPEQP